MPSERSPLSLTKHRRSYNTEASYNSVICKALSHGLNWCINWGKTYRNISP